MTTRNSATADCEYLSRLGYVWLDDSKWASVRRAKRWDCQRHPPMQCEVPKMTIRYFGVWVGFGQLPVDTFEVRIRQSNEL